MSPTSDEPTLDARETPEPEQTDSNDTSSAAAEPRPAKGGDEPDDESEADGRPDLPDTLPILPIGGSVLFPLAVTPVLVGKPRSVELVDAAMKSDRRVVCVRQKDPDALPTTLDELHRVGTVASIHQLQRIPDGPIQLVLQGVERVRILELVSTEPFLEGRIERAPETVEDGLDLEAVTRTVRDLFEQLVAVVAQLPEPLARAIQSVEDPREVAYVVAHTSPLDESVKQELLEEESVLTKLQRLVELLQHEISVRELGAKIRDDTKERMTKAQREYFLRQQLQTIQEELGETDGDESRELREALAAADLPEEARKEADRELARLERIPAASPEHGVIRSYLEWMAELPWGKRTAHEIDVAEAQRILDEDHHGLDDVKDRILEQLAVQRLLEQRLPADAPERQRAPILCFVGPPGVGKTSLGRSIARAMGREFARISLGGVHDESEIRGHRRTYIGSMPGRIIQTLRKVGVSDPLFMLDEMDKLGQGVRGDPSAALLEVLDPAQNQTFTDTYLGVAFDLSHVVFIATANTTDTIPRPLLDRMEVIRLPGYTEHEKVRIGMDFLLPRQVKAHGLTDDELCVDEETVRRIVRDYTREAGVRNLDRTLGKLCRKVARVVAESGRESCEVSPDQLEEFLGHPVQQPRQAERIDRPGVVTGLAWTPMGGELLHVEATLVPGGKGNLTLTGSLGDVMKESAQAAITLIRASAHRFGLDASRLEGHDIHIHVPSGAIPKDGPSAGVTMVTALASALAEKVTRHDVAMTGEITLRGKVLPVGGIKEKVLAAHRAGLTTVILPKWNLKDTEKLPADVLEDLEFVAADTIDDVLAVALPGD